MDQELLVRQIMQEVMKNMQGSAAACECESKVTVEDYPLGEKKPELIKSASGKSLNDLTLQGVIDGKLDAKDFRITKETLELQAQVAESAGRGFFATNLRRAGELIPVPDARLLEIYNALRPYRSTKAELYAIEQKAAERLYQRQKIEAASHPIYDFRAVRKQPPLERSLIKIILIIRKKIANSKNCLFFECDILIRIIV